MRKVQSDDSYSRKKIKTPLSKSDYFLSTVLEQVLQKA